MKNKAIRYFKNGYSCSEAVVKTAVDAGLCHEELVPCATAFSGGMGSGCLCGAVGGAQIVIGSCFGRRDGVCDGHLAREKAKQFMDEFKTRNKSTCCRVLSSKLEGDARKEYCEKYVADAVEILEQFTNVKV